MDIEEKNRRDELINGLVAMIQSRISRGMTPDDAVRAVRNTCSLLNIMDEQSVKMALYEAKQIVVSNKKVSKLSKDLAHSNGQYKK